MSKQVRTNEELFNELWRHVEQPEPTGRGCWFEIETEILLRKWKYIGFHFDTESDTPQLNLVRLFDEEHVI